MIHIGIDVGWSEKRPSCGVALSDGRLPLRGSRRCLRLGGGRIRAACFRLSDLALVLSEWSSEQPEQLADAIIVIDGPLGPGGPPDHDRAVDKQCGTGAFKGRAQPTPISHPSSKPFVGATYKLLEALGPNTFVCINGERPQAGITIIETNPTVALAVMMPQVGLGEIPTRKRPLPFRGALVAAKSDWYWRKGACRQVARALATGKGCDEIAGVSDHEMCAALTCLALAHQFSQTACDGSRAVALGNSDGVYLLPADVDRSWMDGFRSVCWGRVSFGDHGSDYDNDIKTASMLPDPSLWIDDTPEPEQCELAKGDYTVLILADPGGVWQKHNPWLRDMPSPMRLVPVDKADYTIELRRASTCETSGQWTVSPSALEVVRRLAGQRHDVGLSLRNPHSIKVKILD